MEVVFPLFYFISYLTLLVRSKYIFVINEIGLIAVLFIFMGWSNTADLTIYQGWYRAASNYLPWEIPTSWIFYGGRDKGYAIFNSIFNYIGFDFETFRVIYALLYLGITTFFVHKFTKSLLLVILLYILWPFAIDVIQMRTAIVHLMLFISLYFLAQKGRRYEIISLLIILLACTVQIFAILYIPFWFFYKIYQNKVITNFIFIYIVLMPIVYLSPVMDYFSTIINTYFFLNSSDAISTFSTYNFSTSNFGKYAYWIIIVGILSIMYFFKNKFSKRKYNLGVAKIKLNYIEICYAFSLYLSLFLPLYGMSGAEVGRIPRCFMLSFIVAVVMFIDSCKKIRVNICLYVSTALILILFGLVAFYRGVPESALQILIDNPIFNSIGL